MKKIRIVISFFCAIVCLCAYISHAGTTENYIFTTFHMNYGIDIPIAYWTGSDTSPTYHDLTAFPSATLYSTTTPAPRTYNCYTFAFIYDGHVEGFSLLDDSQIFLITQDGSGNENVASYLLSGYSPCMTPTSRDEIVTGDLILYYLLATNENGTDGNMGMNAYTHAAVVTEVNEVIVNGERTVPIENVTVLSKWGTGDLYYHTPTECPYAGEHTNIVYGIGNNEITRTVQLKFFKPNHEYTYTAVVIPPLKPTMTPRSVYHFAECSKCGAYHYEFHDFKQNLCSLCGYYNQVAIQSVPEEVS